MKKHAGIGAAEIVRLLSEKHKDDIFIPECKDGPSQGTNYLRLDAWAMAKSWSNPQATAYEVKVSRSDFLGDNKWPGYLAYCNCFYFVTPTGLVQSEEVSPDCGLMWVSKTGKLYTKKKAPYRQVQIPEEFYRYILMCRVAVTDRSTFGRQLSDPEERRNYWAAWLKERKYRQELGWNVSKALKEVIDSQITAVEGVNRRLEKENAAYAKVKEILTSLGLYGPEYVEEYRIKDRLAQLSQIVHPALIRNMIRLAESLESTAKQLEEAGKPQEVEVEA
jgi:hypothetical protein